MHQNESFWKNTMCHVPESKYRYISPLYGVSESVSVLIYFPSSFHFCLIFFFCHFRYLIDIFEFFIYFCCCFWCVLLFCILFYCTWFVCFYCRLQIISIFNFSIHQRLGYSRHRIQKISSDRSYEWWSFNEKSILSILNIKDRWSKKMHIYLIDFKMKS